MCIENKRNKLTSKFKKCTITVIPTGVYAAIVLLWCKTCFTKSFGFGAQATFVC